MPEWAKWITRFQSRFLFIEVMRMVVLKGSSLADIKYHLLKMGGFALVFNGLGNYQLSIKEVEKNPFMTL
jgi:ABC-2 type transport system permease protein